MSRGIVHPFTGALHEQDGEGNIRPSVASPPHDALPDFMTRRCSPPRRSSRPALASLTTPLHPTTRPRIHTAAPPWV